MQKIYCELGSDDVNQDEEEDDSLEQLFELDYGSSYRLYSHILKKARNYTRGGDGVFEDHIEAEQQYKKAIKLGSIQATHELALLYFSSAEIFNMKKSLELAKQAIEMIADFRTKGTGLATLYDIEIPNLDLLAKIYFYENKLDNSQKAIRMIFEKYRDAMSTILEALENVQMIKISDGSNSIISNELKSLIELKFSDFEEQDDIFDITYNFECKCDEVVNFLFYYFQNVVQGSVPLVAFDLLTNGGIDHVTKLKMNYFFNYALFCEDITSFDNGIKKYKESFCRSVF